MVDIATVLSTLRMQVEEDLQSAFLQLEDLWERKLWFQLSEALVLLYRDPRSASVRFRLFESFVATFEEKLNPLAYVSLAVTATAERPAPDSLAFLRGIAEGRPRGEVATYCELQIAQLLVRQGDLIPAKQTLDRCSNLNETKVVVRAAYYGTACEYYKAKGGYSSYYRNALLYLACANLEEFDAESRRARAYDLAVSALLGDKIYNFGELVLHPILEELGGEYQWLQDLVRIVNNGDIKAFYAHRAHIAKAPLLESNAPFLDQKICLMALCECVFRRGATDRIVPFDVIAKETHLHAESAVEILLLKAFSMDLIRGTIDQIDRTASISWLQPRILDHDQIAQMRDKLRGWDGKVQEMGRWMYSEGESIWV